jgi:hypothetical protein
MRASRKPFSERPFWQRWYQRFMDWLWFGPLTRDLYPRRYPSQFSVAVSLLRDICRDSWSLLWQRLERSRFPDK